MKLMNDCGRGNSCAALRTRKLRSSSARVQHRPIPARRVTVYKCRSSETSEGRYPMLNSKTPPLAYVLAALLGVGATLGVQNHESVRKVSAVKLPNVPGQTLTAEVVEYPPGGKSSVRSEEHTSELQSRQYLVCRLLLEKKKIITSIMQHMITT